MTEPTPTYQTDPTPWTRRELQDALRADGWQRLEGPAAVYQSPDGVLFNLDEHRAPVGILWRYYAARRILPPAKKGRRPVYLDQSRPIPGERPTKAPRPLTTRQQATLNYIIRFKAGNCGDSPTIREIMRGVGIPSTSSAAYTLLRLEQRGYICRGLGNGARTNRIEVVGGRWVYEPQMEMIADWMGSSMAYTGSWDMGEWLMKNMPRIRLHSRTAYLIRGTLDMLGYADVVYMQRWAHEAPADEDVLVISFGMSITTPQLEALVTHDPRPGTSRRGWSYYALPAIARERLMKAVEDAIINMTDEHGRILPDDTIWRKTVDRGGSEQ